MARKHLVAALVFVALLVPLLFDVSFEARFSLPRTVQRVDAAQEERYAACVAGKTDDATRAALRAADNPDVQSLMIRMRQKTAIAECRAAFPEVLLEDEEPLCVNLVDLRWRF